MSGTPAGAVALGQYFYLFKSSVNDEDLLISAHGGYYKNTSSFEVEGYDVCFYGEHNKTLSDPGLKLLRFNDPIVVEQVPNKDTKQCLNYILSKYQGKHGDNVESYKDIFTEMKKIDKAHQKWRTKLINMDPSKSKSIDTYQKMLSQNDGYNVLTIRNRWWKADQNLKAAIEAALKVVPTLKRIHCSFCRSLIGGKNSETSSVHYKMGN